MKLDVECIREILFYLEDTLEYTNELYKHKTVTMYQVIENIHNNKGLDKNSLAYAIEKLCEIHFIEADIKYGVCHSFMFCNIYDISYQGHQFLENIRPESVWEKTKTIVSSVGNHSLKFIEDTAQKCAVTATATFINNIMSQSI